MLGKRKYPDDSGELWLGPGEYGIDPRDGSWYARPPGTIKGSMGNLGNHDVVEHEDGTITVSPSILITVHDNEKNKDVQWHGYLENGIWRGVMT